MAQRGIMVDVERIGRAAARLEQARAFLAAGVVSVLLVGCGTGNVGTLGASPIGASTATTVSAVAPTSPASVPVPTSSATLTHPPETITPPPATATPSVASTIMGSAGPGERQAPTTDLLPPPPAGRFHSSIQPVPLAVLDRSSWALACPVTPGQLRYVTVSFKGFDGRAHTGEMLVNRKAAIGVVKVFRQLFASDWPIEGMRIVTANDLNGTGPGEVNNTSAFTCRAVTGSKTAWSEHAYGLAIDLNPFQNPYLSGRTIIPAQAGAYRERTPARAGMNTSGSLPVRAFRSIGWEWGGAYTSKKDYMHFSATGG
jgi:hypothetical protein